MIKLDLPPLSVNKAFQGRRYRTPEYRSWGDAAKWLLSQLKPAPMPLNRKVGLRVVWHLRNAARCDVDNPLKALCDALVRSGILKDDRLVWKIEAEKVQDKDNFIEFDLFTLSDGQSIWKENKSVVEVQEGVSYEIPRQP